MLLCMNVRKFDMWKVIWFVKVGVQLFYAKKLSLSFHSFIVTECTTYDKSKVVLILNKLVTNIA